MDKKHLTCITCILSMLILLSACTGSKFPTGTYVSETFQTEFNDDGSFIFPIGEQVLSKGTYSVQGDELTWETDSYCDEIGGGKAIYTWTFENDTLLFEVRRRR